MVGALRRRLRALPVAFVLFPAGAVVAQEPTWPPDRQGWYWRPSFRSFAAYEDNVLFTGPKLDSPFLRFSPGVEAYYRRGLRTFSAGYSFDAEKYADPFEALDDAFARQSAFGELETRVDARSSLLARLEFLSTTRPEEVLQETGLLAARRRSRSLVGGARYRRELTRRLSWDLGYAMTVQDFRRPDERIPKLSGQVHTLATGLSLQTSRRTTNSFRYRAQLLTQNDVAPELIPSNHFTSHVVAYEWSRRLSRKIELALLLGPRFSEALEPAPAGDGVFHKKRELEPEANASLTYAGDGKDFTFQYRRSQFLAFGLAGFVDSESVTLNARFEPNVRTRIDVAPGFYRNTRLGVITNGVQLDVGAAYWLTPWVSLEGSYILQRQDGTLLSTDLGERVVPEGPPISRNTVLFGLTLNRVLDLN